MTLWTSTDIAVATGGTANADFAVDGVAFDSREVGEGDLFFAMKGEHSDGHLYLDTAFENGAAGAVVETDAPVPHIKVEASDVALVALARTARARVDAKIIGVTGSAGKTGTKEALFAALDRYSRGKAHRSLKSYNNHVGVPLSLARMPADTRFGIFEMGMNHSGELAALTRLVRPDIAIITTVAPAHIGFFTGVAQIAMAKAEIFQGLQPGGTAIIPRDNPHYELLAAEAAKYAAKVVTFGLHPDSDVRAIDTVRAMGGGSLVTAKVGDVRLCFTVAVPGEHWVVNALAVLAAVDAAGGDLASAGLALADMQGLAGRGARHRIAVDGGEALLIDESYNANPASMQVTLAGLGAVPATRRIAVLGSMKELGDASDEYHAALADPIRAAAVDHVILVGAEMQVLHSELSKSLEKGPVSVLVASAAEAASELARQMRGGDAVLVKGSNSIGLGSVVRALIEEEI